MKSIVKNELLGHLEENMNIIELMLLMNNSIKIIHNKLINALTTEELYNDAIYLYKIKEIYPQYDSFIILDEDDLLKIKDGKRNFNTNIININLAKSIIRYYEQLKHK